MVINRVAPVSLAKVLGLMYMVIGLIFGCIAMLFSLAGGMLAEQAGAGSLGALFGVGAIIFLPLLYGAIGFIGALIFGMLYNLVAGKAGGIEIDVT